ncbi:hypothetical protein BDV93DRAFT_343964 [Ceratobasidium sp. AG-I]|nr:hypothetical protein BDV93DRAFT_343964 [Ceratobasidium sp. AG-I]
MSPTFDTLTEDALRLILALSTPSTIRTCQLVCRSLFNIVQSDSYLLYLLELDASGYVEPSNPRSDLTYSQKRDMVRNNRARWDNPNTVEPIDLRPVISGTIGEWRFVCGVFVQAALLDTLWNRLRQLYFYRLPSPNRGLEYKHWVISDLGPGMECFEIDPEQDLLVLLESKLAERNEELYRLHFRTMSTNEVHPRAAAGSLILLRRHQRHSIQPKYSQLEIFGCLLAISLPANMFIHPSYLVIWNWTTGVEVVYMPTAVDWNSTSFAFLSEDSFVLTRYAQSYEKKKWVLGDSYGSLDVYQFGPHSGGSGKPSCAASFTLPLRDPQHVETLPAFDLIIRA